MGPKRTVLSLKDRVGVIKLAEVKKLTQIRSILKNKEDILMQ